jgi:hypothetical protein
MAFIGKYLIQCKILLKSITEQIWNFNYLGHDIFMMWTMKYLSIKEYVEIHTEHENKKEWNKVWTL